MLENKYCIILIYNILNLCSMSMMNKSQIWQVRRVNKPIKQHKHISKVKQSGLTRCNSNN